MLASLKNWTKDISLELRRIFNRLEMFDDRTARSHKQINDRLLELEKIMGILAEKIKQLVAVETAEGAVIKEESAKLKAALEAANTKISALEAENPALKAEIAALKADLADADIAANAIADINPTPVSDGIVTEVVENPAIETPAIVEDAPAVAPEVIQEVPVVEAAVDAIVAAE
ncbi:MAG: hypothetical protein ACRC62_15745 [Microcoleus sp.]